MSGIKLLLILVIAVLIVVLFKYVQIKRQIRNLSKQMTDLTTGKSEKMLDISLVDKDIEQLAAVLNQYDNLKLKCICVGLHRPGYIENILNIVGLGNVGKKKVGHFSLGMKQRLGIGMALVGEPDVLVLDEPINGLDPEGIAEVRETLLRLNKEKGLTIIISSHILEELSKIATNYAIIDKGQLVKELSREELEATCREHIEIKMEHPDLALPVLDALGFKDYRVADENTIHIFERLNESGKITMELSRKNIYIHSISVTNESIEDYFLRLTGGVDHA